MRVYAVRDNVAGTFALPTFYQSDALIMRDFRVAMADPDFSQTGLVKSSQDYDLFYLGDYDERAGELVPQMPVKLCCLADLMEVQNG